MNRNGFLGGLRIPRLRTILFVLAAFALGLLMRSGGGGDSSSPQADDHDHAAKAQVWTCSMHPQIRQPGPGQCPICGMDLIPVSAEASESGDARELKLSPRAKKLAEIRTAGVERRYVAAELRMVGRVAYDETRVKRISAWVPGRLDRLFVDYTGTRVAAGDHLVQLYSPDLITAQEELIQAIRAEAMLGERASESSRKGARETVTAVREKLALLGLGAEQIRDVERRGKPMDHVLINAPVGGIVIHKDAVEGAYVQTGTPIYTIADLSVVWVMLDAYESDLRLLRYGQEVTFSTEAYPGETFHGRITFIDPVLDERTRTVKVRVNMPNDDGRLKPGMFVSTVLEARFAENGAIYDAALAGKWISPMHPEIVKDGPGTCDVCGMALVPTESLGYVSTDPGELRPPLVIPASAPLITGKRSVVYVADPERGGFYSGREVVLGPRAGDFYVVKSGLAEGEAVVVSGAFKIDSALQILARPSMMSPDGGGQVPGHNHGGAGGAAGAGSPQAGPVAAPAAFMSQLEAVYQHYFAVQYALSHDDAASAAASAGKLRAALGAVDMGSLAPQAHIAWMDGLGGLQDAARSVAAAGEIKAARAAFETLSTAMAGLARRFGRSGEAPILVYHCPMAFDNRGADWLQEEPGTANPYFGSMMFGCGSMTAELPSDPMTAMEGDHE